MAIFKMIMDFFGVSISTEYSMFTLQIKEHKMAEMFYDRKRLQAYYSAKLAAVL